MKRFSLLAVASAVAAALAAPVALAQTSGGDGPRGTDRNVTDGRSGGTNVPSSPSGATPSTQPNQDRPAMQQRNPADAPAASGDRMGERRTGTPGDTSAGGARSSERSSTDGRTGGTGPNSGSDASISTNQRMGTSGGTMHGQTHGAGTVRNVQQSLQDKGFDVGPIDGIMGPRTEAALREFQQRQGIQSTGQLNAETMSALDVRAGGDNRSQRMNSGRSGG